MLGWLHLFGEVLKCANLRVSRRHNFPCSVEVRQFEVLAIQQRTLSPSCCRFGELDGNFSTQALLNCWKVSNSTDLWWATARFYTRFRASLPNHFGDNDVFLGFFGILLSRKRGAREAGRVATRDGQRINYFESIDL